MYEEHKEADLKTRINAVKEILKRYPDNDKLLEQQIRKLKAEADISEAKAKAVKSNNLAHRNKIDDYLDQMEHLLNDEK